MSCSGVSQWSMSLDHNWTTLCCWVNDTLSNLQWMKSGTGLWTLKEAASRSLQISTLSPAMMRTAALFSSSKICLWSEAHSSNMKSSGRKGDTLQLRGVGKKSIRYIHDVSFSLCSPHKFNLCRGLRKFSYYSCLKLKKSTQHPF